MWRYVPDSEVDITNFIYRGYSVQKDNGKYYLSRDDWVSSYSIDTDSFEIAKDRIDFILLYLDNKTTEGDVYKLLVDLKAIGAL